MVRKEITLIISAIAVVFAIGMAVSLVAYLPAASQIDILNAQIKQKDQSITALNSQIVTLTAQVNSQTGDNSTSSNTILQQQISNLETQIESLNNIFYLNATAYLASNQQFTLDSNSNATLWNQDNNPLIYAGYITIQLASSSNTTYVELAYNSYNVVYDRVVTLGTGGTTTFPVLPGTIIIAVGSTEATSIVTGTVSVTYTY